MVLGLACAWLNGPPRGPHTLPTSSLSDVHRNDSTPTRPQTSPLTAMWQLLAAWVGPGKPHPSLSLSRALHGAILNTPPPSTCCDSAVRVHLILTQGRSSQSEPRPYGGSSESHILIKRRDFALSLLTHFTPIPLSLCQKYYGHCAGYQLNVNYDDYTGLKLNLLSLLLSLSFFFTHRHPHDHVLLPPDHSCLSCLLPSPAFTFTAIAAIMLADLFSLEIPSINVNLDSLLDEFRVGAPCRSSMAVADHSPEREPLTEEESQSTTL
ncbi:hypothetical protein SRHO_G00199190 [Serrasalmus rhombeus]